MAEKNQTEEENQDTREQGGSRDQADWNPGGAETRLQSPSDVDLSGLADLFQGMRFPADKAEVLQRVPTGRTYPVTGPGGPEENVIRVDLNRIIAVMGRDSFGSESELLGAIREAVLRESRSDLELTRPSNQG